MVYLKLFLLIILFQINTVSQDISSFFKERGEIKFKFQFMDKAELNTISKIISIDEIDLQNHSAIAYSNQKQLTKFIELGYDFSPISYEQPKGISTTDNLEEAMEWDVYPTYETYVTIMQKFATDYPSLCQVYSIGTSTEGREMLFAKISDNVSQTEAEPQFFYTSTMHGDETTGYVLMLHLIDYLLKNYRTNVTIRNLVNNLEIWINPNANPDGTYAGGNNTVSGATRYNANWVDLNRNFPDPQDGIHPDGEVYQAETLLMIEFAENHDFVMSSNFHGGTEVINYPWDTWYERHPDDNWWQLVSHEYADTAQEYSPSGYMNSYDDGITNGYDWYEVAGGRQDFMNYFHHCREMTAEISDIKLVDESQLLPHWEYNYRSLLNYMEQSLFGIQGIITDSVTNEPVVAKITVLDHDEDSSEVYSNTMGRFSRPIYVGNYSIKIEASGYYTKVLDGIEVANNEQNYLEINLIPTYVAVQDVNKPLEFKLLQNYPNPISKNTNQANTKIKFVIPFSTNNEITPIKVVIFNALGEKIQELVNKSFTIGEYEVNFNVSNLPSGVYFYQLQSGHYFETKKIIICD